MYVPINPLGYSCIKKLQRDNLWHAYNEPINFYSAQKFCHPYFHWYIHCKPIPVMKTGFSLCTFSHREKPVSISWDPCNENRFFPVGKKYTGKSLFWPCTDPVRDCSVVIGFRLLLKLLRFCISGVVGYIFVYIKRTTCHTCPSRITPPKIYEVYDRVDL